LYVTQKNVTYVPFYTCNCLLLNIIMHETCFRDIYEENSSIQSGL